MKVKESNSTDNRIKCEWCGKKYSDAALTKMVNNWNRTGKEPRCTKCREYMMEPFEGLAFGGGR